MGQSRGTVDVVVIGAGIVGLATARALLMAEPSLDIQVIDKEDRVAAHQSGHNSGVIHSGIYYPPGSTKSRMVAAGRDRLLAFVDDHDIPHEVCGKVVVATTVAGLGGLEALRGRASENGTEAELISRRELHDLEPHCAGLAALHVPSAGVVDFAVVSDALAHEVQSLGGELLLGQQVTGVREGADGVDVDAIGGAVTARLLVNCAGLQADRVAAMAGQDTGVRIMPFRGEFMELSADATPLVRHLIYPVPDPRFPFLGVHLTRGIDGTVHAGPNAVAALTREGYSWSDADAEGVRELLLGGDSRRLARRYWRTGSGEIFRSLSHRAATRAVRELVPEINGPDLLPGGSGVRAQAIRPDGTLVDDFEFAETDRVVSVLNAPSPAATASLEIGRAVAQRVLSASGAGARASHVTSAPSVSAGPIESAAPGATSTRQGDR